MYSLLLLRLLWPDSYAERIARRQDCMFNCMMGLRTNIGKTHALQQTGTVAQQG